MEDEEGFRYPEINMDQCIHCSQCEKVCPVNKEIAGDHSFQKPKAYVAYSIDKDIRAKSVTAGLAYLCGESVIEQGGVVFGVVGDVLSKVYHNKAVTLDELSPMRGSKYLQSDVGYSFREVKEELVKGKMVLFTGTPCQIAGLYSYLGKEYFNLYTLDLICHGVPSGMVLKKYIEELETKAGCKVISFYRDKEKGFSPTCFSYVLENGSKISQKGLANPYNHAYITNIITRKSCQKCPYAKIPRIADITLGDCLKADKRQLFDKENKGLSIVTVNSPKGCTLFDRIRNQIQTVEYPVGEIVAESEHLAKTPKFNIFRRSYFFLIKKYSFTMVDRLLLPKNTVHKMVRRVYGILCYFYELFKEDSLIK